MAAGVAMAIPRMPGLLLSGLLALGLSGHGRAGEADWTLSGRPYRYAAPGADLGGEGGPGARFRGRLKLSGRYLALGEQPGCGSALVFEPDPEALKRLPRHKTQGAAKELWFADEPAALRALGLEAVLRRVDGFEYCSVHGTAAIEIGDLESNVDCDRRWYAARLIGVVDAGEPVLERCGRQRCTVNDPTGTPLNVRERAGRASPVIDRLNNGTPVNLIDEGRDRDTRGWAYVEWRDGDTVRGGWVFRNHLSACAP